MIYDLQTITDALAAAVATAEAGGWRVYANQFHVERVVPGQGAPYFYMRLRIELVPPDGSSYAPGWQYADNVTILENATDADIDAAVGRFSAAVAKFPSLDDHMAGRYKAALTDLADKGQALGIWAAADAVSLKLTAGKIDVADAADVAVNP